ncbi:PILR alpha-associated neural protein isoform X3 [Ambystoma mexicanum]|uniref:PILR alpha-associated neural protein isoform X3 n=1 Tax=Ambystoma mexicanum TaxID=8296 RepID=UPI0037E73ADA
MAPPGAGRSPAPSLAVFSPSCPVYPASRLPLPYCFFWTKCRPFQVWTLMTAAITMAGCLSCDAAQVPPVPFFSHRDRTPVGDPQTLTPGKITGSMWKDPGPQLARNLNAVLLKIMRSRKPPHSERNPRREPWHLRRRRQVPRIAVSPRSATPSGFDEGQPSSQYPWAIVWGPTISDEEGMDASSADVGSLHLDYGRVSPHGMVTPFPNSRLRNPDDGLNLKGAPATLKPFLFGPRAEGIDPQLYVTISISAIIVLVATGIIIKFCWDRNQKRRHHSAQQNPLQQEDSQQPLTDLSPGPLSVFSSYGDSLKFAAELESLAAQECKGKMENTPKNPVFQLNRIPLVNL